jgi:Ser/Thr protein kinase RdoA (MazF antagonist)
MWQRVVDRPDQSAALGRLLADIQHGLFALVPPVTLPRQRDRIVSKIRRTAATVDPAFARALSLLPPEAGTPRLCHGDLHPSNVILGRDGPLLVDWFDAARGDPLADIARSSLTMLSDGAQPPEHLPGSDQATLRRLTDAYLARLQEHVEIDHELLARWQAVSAVARLAEGVQSGPLLEVWQRYARAEDGQAAANSTTVHRSSKTPGAAASTTSSFSGQGSSIRAPASAAISAPARRTCSAPTDRASCRRPRRSRLRP